MSTDDTDSGDAALTYERPPDESVCEGIVRAVSIAAAADPVPDAASHRESLDPLYAAVDPDALDALLRRSDADTSVSFPYHGHDVTVHGTGLIEVRSSEQVAACTSD